MMIWRHIICAASLLALMIPASMARAATVLNFTVTTSENVTVNTAGGTPRLALTVGTATRYANYASGSGTSALIFTYNVSPGDLDLDGIAIASPLQLNGGTITDLGGSPMTNSSFTLPTTSGIKINYPAVAADFMNNAYVVGANTYSSLASFLAGGASFTRASVGTYYNSSGILTTAASGQPRFDYDPATLSARGLLIEESRTNMVVNSNNFSSASWTVAGGSLPQVSTTTAPDGSTVPVYSVSTNAAIYQDYAITNGQTATHSIWIKANKTATIGFRRPGQNPACNLNPAINTMITVNTNWQRFVLTDTATYTPSRILVDNRNGNGCAIGPNTGLELAFFGAQAEIAPNVSTYIPTAASTVTRQADRLVVPAGAWYSAAAGTLVTEASVALAGRTTSDPGLAAIDNSTANEAVEIIFNDTGSDVIQSNIVAGGATQFTANSSFTYVPPAVVRGGLTYTTNNAIAAYNGTLGTLDTSVTMPATATNLRIGNRRNNTAALNGWVRKFYYYPVRATNAELQTLTTP